jgi:ATP-dependent Clp protease ATP-binding subunit ClpC
MFERYTESARRCLFFARYEASQFGSLTIESEHMLLGVAREAVGPMRRFLAEAHCWEDLHQEVAAKVATRPKTPASTEIPFSGEMKRILQFSAEEADRLHHDFIRVEHLMLGILREETSTAAAILTEHGVRLDDARKVATETTTEEPDAHQLRMRVSHLAFVAQELRAALPDAESRVIIERLIADLKALKAHLGLPE